MLLKLRQHLASISAEQFQAEWHQIESQGFGGIPVAEFLKNLHQSPTVSSIHVDENITSNINSEFLGNLVQENTFSLAA